MGTAPFLRKLQDIHTKHKLISTIFLCLFVLPFSAFYCFFAAEHITSVSLTNPTNSDVTNNNLMATTLHYIRVVVEVEGFAFLAISLISLLTPLLHILESEKIDPEMELSFKSLLLILTKSARSLLVTWFAVRLLKLGYIFVGMLVFHQKLMLNSQICAIPGTGTLILVAGAVFFYNYLAVVWNMALVVASHEEKSLLEAFGKASQLVEGKRRKLHGFLLNLVLGVLSLVMFVGWEYLTSCAKMMEADNRGIKLNILNCMYLIEIWTWSSFSILYFKCKKDQGEAIQVKGISKRIQSTTAELRPLISASVQV